MQQDLTQRRDDRLHVDPANRKTVAGATCAALTEAFKAQALAEDADKLLCPGCAQISIVDLVERLCVENGYSLRAFASDLALTFRDVARTGKSIDELGESLRGLPVVPSLSRYTAPTNYAPAVEAPFPTSPTAPDWTAAG